MRHDYFIVINLFLKFKFQNFIELILIFIFQ